MRIVIDLQGAQGSSRNRGIGYYSISLATAIARNRGAHEIIVALSDLFPETIAPIRRDFETLLPRDNIHVWTAPGPVNHLQKENDWRRRSAELTRETFLASFCPDVVLTSSLFEGLGDDVVTSIGAVANGPATAVILFDLIPLIHRKVYLGNPATEAWYFEKIEHLRRADLSLAISDSCRDEGLAYLQLPEQRCVSISSAAKPQFRRIEMPQAREREVRARYGLDRPFVMYTGGIDHRKNMDGLIAAFARLPAHVRENHKLAIVCFMSDLQKEQLETLARRAGLAAEDLVLTGFIPDEDLIALYNLCTLFVFPSWHEGFGLPVLEAMHCGAPVVGSNVSSIPEVIGLDEALFDPNSVASITDALHRGLTNQDYRRRLVEHAKVQAPRFSWDQTAQRAIAAMERLNEERSAERRSAQVAPAVRPRLAFVSPLPPERSGIADYSAELLRALSAHYRIDVIVTQKTISDPWVSRNCAVRSPEQFVADAGSYDRVLYHFGNSRFHEHMFDLLRQVPGVVVLHDFFLSNILADMEWRGSAPGLWTRALYEAHGYTALKARLTASDVADVIWAYPCSLDVIRGALGMIAHSPNTLRLARQWFGDDGMQWAVIPLLRDPAVETDRQAARKRLGIGPSDFLVCSFGMIAATKQSQCLLQAWLKSALAGHRDCRLVFVGENASSEYGKELRELAHSGEAQERVQITGWVDAATYQDYLAAADMAVQLRTLSRGETSAAILDCMKHGLPTIVNANGSMADIDADAVWKLPDEFSEEELIEALEQLWRDAARRTRLGEAARRAILEEHDPQKCAAQYHAAIECFYRREATGWRSLPAAIAALPGAPDDQGGLMHLADALARTFPAQPRQKQILVDVTYLAERDVGTGIHRVVRNVLEQWLQSPPEGYRIEPVLFATQSQRYYYARNFTVGFLGGPAGLLEDEPVDVASGDIFLALDLNPDLTDSQRAFFREAKRYGVRVIFAVYDLLPALLPQYFSPRMGEVFARWLTVAAENDGVVCISRAVADEFAEWSGKNTPNRSGRFFIKSFQLGADLDVPSASRGLPEDAEAVLQRIAASPSFLMVGTLEPRKGHIQTLAAFESLWAKGLEINLVIVGKTGWGMEEFWQKLRDHPCRGTRLFWLEGISDEYLERVYAEANCLIAASEGEGFGLPLIEAARHRLPVLARDIPVFREVAGGHATYFKGVDPADLAAAISDWLDLYREGRHPKSDGISWVDWRESAAQLIAAILCDAPMDERHSSIARPSDQDIGAKAAVG